MKTLLFLLLTITTHAQVYQFTGEAVSVKNTYGDWSEWEETSVLIILNIDKEIIQIYSKREQRYDIISASDKIYDSESESVILDCIDEEGIRCKLQLYNYDKGYKHLYIRWDNIQYVYQIVAK